MFSLLDVLFFFLCFLLYIYIFFCCSRYAYVWQEWQQLEAAVPEGGENEAAVAAGDEKKVVPALLQMAANQVQQDESLTEVRSWCLRYFRLFSCCDNCRHTDSSMIIVWVFFFFFIFRVAFC